MAYFLIAKENTCLIYKEKKLVKRRDVLTHFQPPDTQTWDSSPWRTCVVLWSTHIPRPSWWASLHFQDTGWGVLRGKDRCTRGAPPHLAPWSSPISSVFPPEGPGVQSQSQAPQETARLELGQTFVPGGFLFSLELAHVITEATFLC